MSVRVLAYRPDIDGLRALAVISVVLFHVNESLAPGGFVGVDIFFVISGFLITSIIRRQIADGSFSFGGFYRGRILRIAPAYVAVTLATLVAGCMLMLPADLAALGRSALWSAFSLPNVYFWKFLDTSYFAASSDQVPLLHLWSLGVEEQFYLLWPLTLLVSLRWFGSRAAIAVTVAIAVASFVLAESTIKTDTSFAYYMLPARAGELMVGALLALWIAAGTKVPGKVAIAISEASALIGFALIGYALVMLDSESLFPGINALFPCLGTALIIFAGRHRAPWISAPLRWRPVVWIGLISYSLYLWHWPVLAFVRYFTVTISPGMGWACLGLIVLLSVLSYRYVERPFRQGPLINPARGNLAPAMYAASVALLAIAALALQSDGVVRRVMGDDQAYLAKVQELSERTRPALAYRYNCQRSKLDATLFKEARCVIKPSGAGGSGKVNAILLGDSNAAHYIGVIGAIGEAEGFGFRNVTLSSCPPLFGGGDKYGRPTDRPGCSRYRAAARREVRNYDYVLLGGQWSYHSRRPGFAKDLARTVREISAAGKTILVLGQAPRFKDYDRDCELRRLRLKAIDCRARAEASGRVDRRINALLKATIDDIPRAYYLDVNSVVCPRGQCSPYLGGQPIYSDPGHMSMTGSWDIGNHMVEHYVPSRNLFARMGTRNRAANAQATAP